MLMYRVTQTDALSRLRRAELVLRQRVPMLWSRLPRAEHLLAPNVAVLVVRHLTSRPPKGLSTY